MELCYQNLSSTPDLLAAQIRCHTFIWTRDPQQGGRGGVSHAHDHLRLAGPLATTTTTITTYYFYSITTTTTDYYPLLPTNHYYHSSNRSCSKPSSLIWSIYHSAGHGHGWGGGGGVQGRMRRSRGRWIKVWQLIYFNFINRWDESDRISSLRVSRCQLPKNKMWTSTGYATWQTTDHTCIRYTFTDSTSCATKRQLQRGERMLHMHQLCHHIMLNCLWWHLPACASSQFLHHVTSKLAFRWCE